ncbi:hypothetical protein COCCADRAFT_34498 [Bipolaris zeicola 26-R-13]|uniref:Uncharacterized protein n=1 Tax=Cochliobolus carbonum (strain 26-R-13) TaxID=930089 RepID=W6YX27_COCC2|nr:uncharacterized protein COCCADRAFT_34498 [Bipolaris zeicola 26-R-13]EUC36066.1 hypothetical protein COCCADRAFT_34498 [Bipolaris zeicola 26-R-13]
MLPTIYNSKRKVTGLTKVLAEWTSGSSQHRCFARTTSTRYPNTTDNAGALQGLKVLDLSRVLAAPFCTQILADYGAEVIKVETIGKGDDTRHWTVKGEGPTWQSAAQTMSNYFTSVNRNKKPMTLNLKNHKGKKILFELAKQTDVLGENFKPGTMECLGLVYDKLKAVNPRLIYASISGYVNSGPFAHRGGYDPIAGAEAGLLYVTGEHNGPPVRPGIGMRGEGQRVDASLFETQISLLTNVGLAWLNLGIEAQRWGCAHPSIVPYDAFKTKDQYLVCGATNDAQFVSLCHLLDLEALIKDERFATNPKRVENRQLLTPMFNTAFQTKTTSEWTKLFQDKSLPFAPINNMESTFVHPQAAARDMIAEMETEAVKTGRIKVIGPAVKFSQTAASLRTPPPVLDEIEKLREAGVVSRRTISLTNTSLI